jgi:hypothetical protein
MRIISVVGIVFIPLSAVSSIFGTQFFTSVIGTDGSEDPKKAATPSYMNINPQFWVMWAVVIPIMVTVLAVWIVWEYWSKFSPLLTVFASLKRKRKEKDLETG